MTKSNLPQSVRKYIRREKARIRREIFGFKEQAEEITKLYQKFKAVRKTKTSPSAKRRLTAAYRGYVEPVQALSA